MTLPPHTEQRLRVLVIDDEPAVRESLIRALELEGEYEVEVASDGHEGLERLSESPRDVILLDVMMPRLDGLQVCRRMRERGDRTPVLMLTAKEAVSERVAGLEAGADDYLVKPFALEELLARIRALIRRSVEDGDQPLVFSDLRLDPLSHQAWRGSRLLELTRTEYLLLELFLRNPRRVLTREMIFDRVWGYDFGPTSNALKVYISYLRRKLEENGEPRLIDTVRSVGYVLREG